VPFVVLAVALIAAGSAYAASKLHGSSSPGSAGSPSATSISANGGGYSAGGPAGDHHGRRGGDLAAAATYLEVTQADLLSSLQSGKTLAQVAAATYLGVTEAALTTQLQAGKTLAQVAAATSGKSAAGLIDALVAAEQTELTAAVKAGTITQAQSDQIATTLKDRFTALVNGTRPAHDGRQGGLRQGFAPRGTVPGNPAPAAPATGTHI
jgi:hypothetical protein